MLEILNRENATKTEDWPRDTFPYIHSKQPLSFSKMVNELNHKEARQVNAAGVV
jgi:hypothetical protein